jgi:hypothetical protein
MVMNARLFVRVAVVAILATTGCAGTQKVTLSTRTVCVKRTQPAAVAIAVRDEHIAIGDRALWALPSDGPVDEPRAFALGANALAVAFRQGDAIWVGVVDDTQTPRSALYRVGGNGHWLGAPAVRVDGDEVRLAWRDGDEVKLTTWHTSGAPDAPRSIDAGGVSRFCDGAAQ